MKYRICGGKLMGIRCPECKRAALYIQRVGYQNKLGVRFGGYIGDISEFKVEIIQEKDTIGEQKMSYYKEQFNLGLVSIMTHFEIGKCDVYLKEDYGGLILSHLKVKQLILIPNKLFFVCNWKTHLLNYQNYSVKSRLISFRELIWEYHLIYTVRKT